MSDRGQWIEKLSVVEITKDQVHSITASEKYEYGTSHNIITKKVFFIPVVRIYLCMSGIKKTSDGENE